MPSLAAKTLAPVARRPMPEIFLFISSRMTPQRRAAVSSGGRLGRRLSFFLSHPLRRVATYWWATPTHRVKVVRLASGEAVVFEAVGASCDEPGFDSFSRGPWSLVQRVLLGDGGCDWVAGARAAVNDRLRREGRMPLKKLRDGR